MTLRLISPLALRLRLHANTDWTAFTQTDGKIVYVDSSQPDDTGNGLTTGTAKKTIAAGYALLDNGSADWLLLKKGGVWTDDLWSGNGFFGKNGKSATEPMLIGAYGTGARPLIKTSPGYCDAALFNTGGAVGDYLAVVGIEFYAHTRDPDSLAFDDTTLDNSHEHKAISLISPSNWQLIEDCKFSFYQVNISFETGPFQNVSIRRNVIVDAYNISPGHSVGLYANNIINPMIEENIIIHNGFNDDVTGAEPTVFNQNVYFNYQGPNGDDTSVSGPVTFRGNVSADASATGCQLRPGGTAYNNLFAANPIALTLQNTADPSIDVRANVILDGRDLLPGGGDNSRTQGILWVYGAGTLSGNIIAHQRAAGSTNAVGLSLGVNVSGQHPTANIFYDWDNAIDDAGTGNDTTGNDIDAVGYSAPNRTLGDYAGSIGLTATQDALFTAMRAQSKDNWDTRLMAAAVNNYIRAGFDMAAV